MHKKKKKTKKTVMGQLKTEQGIRGRFVRYKPTRNKTLEVGTKPGFRILRTMAWERGFLVWVNGPGHTGSVQFASEFRSIFSGFCFVHPAYFWNSRNTPDYFFFFLFPSSVIHYVAFFAFIHSRERRGPSLLCQHWSRVQVLWWFVYKWWLCWWLVWLLTAEVRYWLSIYKNLTNFQSIRTLRIVNLYGSYGLSIHKFYFFFTFFKNLFYCFLKLISIIIWNLFKYV